MKLAILPLFALTAVLSAAVVRASESAPDCETAIGVLKAGIEIHPDQAGFLFQDALQTNPACRRLLFTAAAEMIGQDAESLVELIRIARLEFPDEDNLFAEAAVSVAPQHAGDIRDAFMSPVEPAALSLASGSVVDPSTDGSNRIGSSGENLPLDEEVRDAIARMNARKEGKFWPEQELSEGPLHFRKPDEIRISKKFKHADEGSLVGSLPLDGTDERIFPEGPIAVDDSRRPSEEIRLDESKFEGTDRTASTGPLDAKSRSLEPAGAMPALPKSSVYPIARPAGVVPWNDEEDFTPEPPLVIRPDSASPTAPR
jgi:hypothetical protein